MNAPRCQQDYAVNFNSVDCNDQDRSDYTTSIQTNRWYLRVFFWVLDHIVHVVFVVVCYLYKDKVGADDWMRFTEKIEEGVTFKLNLELL